MLDGDKFAVLTPQSNGRTAASASSSSEDLIDLNSEVEVQPQRLQGLPFNY